MAVTAMEDDTFWHIIDRNAQSGLGADARVEALRADLRKRSLEEIVSFDAAFSGYLDRSYSWDLWGAAYVVHGGCSDDCFEYFRRWLVSRGREAYEAALADPDSLAQLSLQPTGPDNVWEFEEIGYVAIGVLEERGRKRDLLDDPDPEAGLTKTGPSGEPFDEDEEYLSKRYPRLWQRFGDDPQ